MRIYFIVVAVLSLVGVFMAGSYSVVDSIIARGLYKKAAEEFQNGNYAAALNLYGHIEENDSDGVDAKEKIEEARKLLVAEDTFQKARKAAEGGDWLEVKALLQKSDATLNPSFKLYEEAIDLYIESANRVKELEEKIDAELAQFRAEALTEKTKRKQAEEEKEEVKTQLETTISQKEQREKELEESLSKTEAARAEAEAKAQDERLQKFLSEVALYVSMLEKGNGHLEDAREEISEKKDTTALVLINQGKVLFDEVRVRAEELLANRTEEGHEGGVQKILQAVAILIDASRSLGNAVFYIEEQDTEEFSQFLVDARNNQSTALKLLGEL